MDSNFDFQAWDMAARKPKAGRVKQVAPLLVLLAFAIAYFVFVLNAGSHPVADIDQFAREWGAGP